MASFYGHLAHRIDVRLRYSPEAELGSQKTAGLVTDAASSGSINLVFDSPSPSFGEAILAAYRQWGVECVHHLRGQFSFALWDVSAQLFLAARDPLGMRPLYYADFEDTIYVGSSPETIRSFSSREWTLDELRVADYLMGTREDANLGRSFFQKISCLPAGSRMIVRQGKLEIEPYWQFRQLDVQEFGTDADATSAFRTILETSVNDSLQTAVPTAAMLSGGLDSSLLACVTNPIMMANAGETLTVFSGVTGLPVDCPDPYYIRGVSEKLGLKQRAIVCEELDTFSPELQGFFSRLAEPFDAGMTLVAVSYLAAHKAGFKAVIDGVDGDLVGSLSDQYLGRLLRDVQLRTLAKEFFSMGKIWSEEVNLPGLFRYTLLPDLVPGSLKQVRRYFSARRASKTISRATLLSSEFASNSGLLDQFEAEVADARVEFPATMADVHLRRIDSPALTAGIERYGRVANACGVERISPLLDLRVIEFLRSLPWHYKVRGGQSKVLFRTLLREYGLDELANRHDKYGLGLHFTRQWMSLNASLDRRLLDKEEGRLECYLDMDEYLSAKIDYFEDGRGDDVRMWRVIHLLRWLVNQESSSAA